LSSSREQKTDIKRNCTQPGRKNDDNECTWLCRPSKDADVEVIKIQGINEAYERMLKGEVKYRFVIDMASLKG